MILRRSCVFLLVLAGLAQAAPVHAQIFKKVIHSICLDTKRNNCWPKPFVLPDRQSVRAPMQMMVQNGWHRQNLLGNHHFDKDTGELTEAGELKIRWIVTQVPKQHRVLFVSRGESSAQTVARLGAVEQAVTQLAPEGELPSVIESGLDPGGWPASRVDAIGRKLEDVMPEPRLRDFEPAGSSGN